jgi:histidine ammonia-lyase
MAAFAARRLLAMVDNSAGIVAIELLAACQGIDFRAPLTTSKQLQKAHTMIRSRVPFLAEDRHFAPDIGASKALVFAGDISRATMTDCLL